MQTKVAIWGNEQFDFVFYLSRILHSCNKNVLLIDCTAEKSLKAAVPIPSDIKQGIIDYRGISFCDHLIEDESFDVVIYNVNGMDHILSQCNQVILVTDLFDYNIKRINQCNLFKNPVLVVRDVINHKITDEYIVSLLDKKMTPKCIYSIDQDNIDYKLKLDCYYNNVIKFKKLSRSYKDVLVDITSLVIEEKKAAIEKAFKVAERGK